MTIQAAKILSNLAQCLKFNENSNFAANEVEQLQNPEVEMLRNMFDSQKSHKSKPIQITKDTRDNHILQCNLNRPSPSIIMAQRLRINT